MRSAATRWRGCWVEGRWRGRRALLLGHHGDAASPTPSEPERRLACRAHLCSEGEEQGPDGRIPGGLLIPLVESQSRAGEAPMDRPTMVLCPGHTATTEEGADPAGHPARRHAGLEGAAVGPGASLSNHAIALICSRGHKWFTDPVSTAGGGAAG
jgi:hypothetical protein